MIIVTWEVVVEFLIVFVFGIAVGAVIFGHERKMK